MAEMSGFKPTDEDWYELRVSPFHAYVWRSIEHDRRDEWDIVIHFGDRTITKNGFLEPEHACAYALERMIEETEKLLKDLVPLRNKGDQLSTHMRRLVHEQE